MDRISLSQSRRWKRFQDNICLNEGTKMAIDGEAVMQWTMFFF